MAKAGIEVISLNTKTGAKLVNGEWIKYTDRKFRMDDVIGVFHDKKEGRAWFSLNGEDLGIAYQNVKDLLNTDLYPTVSFKTK